MVKNDPIQRSMYTLHVYFVHEINITRYYAPDLSQDELEGLADMLNRPTELPVLVTHTKINVFYN